jgi:hypothetical protein
VDSLSRPQSKSGFNILGFGKPLIKWLQQVFGYKPERYVGNTDQLINFVLKELGRHAILVLNEYGSFAELANAGYIGNTAQHFVQRIEVLPPEATREDG